MTKPDLPPSSIAVGPGEPRSFTTTLWGVVLAAGQGSSASSQTALATLCAAYWHPLYSFIRRQGHTSHDSEDLTQAFFGWLLKSNQLSVADPGRGRFRSFLLTMLMHFLSDERKRTRAQKRGGGQAMLSLDALLAEKQHALEPATQLTAEQLFDQRWAVVVLEQTVARLRAEYLASDREKLFEELKHFQPGEKTGRSYAEVAARLGLSEGGVKSAVYRLRQRHRDLLREEIAQTVATAAEVDEEIRYLISVMSA